MKLSKTDKREWKKKVEKKNAEIHSTKRNSTNSKPKCFVIYKEIDLKYWKMSFWVFYFSKPKWIEMLFSSYVLTSFYWFSTDFSHWLYKIYNFNEVFYCYELKDCLSFSLFFATKPFLDFYLFLIRNLSVK